ncbi:MAG: NADH-quinone oxidoreductase subunit NuoE [Candidatus Adiutrix sp.]|jgi:NADH-quinone oxidoreductase E subunit|nr:NADH-quinone oxidoreductase subunit NuoE [Candidatus Adiutrix sp.]
MSTEAQAKCQGLDLTKLEPVFELYTKNKDGSLIPVLQKAQDAYGYLPVPVLEVIADRLEVPISQVYGVVTFYAQFHLEPRGKNIIRTCQGTACHVRGASKILDALKEGLGVGPGGTTEDLQFTLETVACIGACGLAPVIMVNQETHGRLTPDSIPEILDKYRK